MLGFRKFILEDDKKQGKLISDIQDLRRQTQLLRQKMLIQKEMEKIRNTRMSYMD